MKSNDLQQFFDGIVLEAGETKSFKRDDMSGHHVIAVPSRLVAYVRNWLVNNMPHTMVVDVIATATSPGMQAANVRLSSTLGVPAPGATLPAGLAAPRVPNMSPAAMHPHAVLMREYADDAMLTPEPWRRWQVKQGGVWDDLTGNPGWLCMHQYRRKPRTIRIGTFDVPEPMQTPPEDGQWVYYPSLGEPKWCCALVWHTGGTAFNHIFNRRMLHTTEAAAVEHAKALAALTAV